MIYLTGDTHGGIDLRKLTGPEVTGKLTAQDYLIICGDFGFIWKNKHESHKEKSWLRWFSRMPWTTLFVDGNHENFPRLAEYPEKEWNGGKIHEIRPHVFHLMRSQIFTIEGSTFFTLGGAASHDRGPAVGDHTIEGRGWWAEEIPSDEELHQAADVLQQHDSKVDFIVTHCLPTSMQKIVKGDAFHADKLTEFLEEVKNHTQYQHWYCGHYHRDLDLCDNVSVLFNRVVLLGDTVAATPPLLGEPIYRREDRVVFLKDDEVFCGTIKNVYPWGKLKIKGQPAYDILEDGEADRTEIISEDTVLGHSI